MDKGGRILVCRVCPDRGSFRAVGTDIDIFPALKQLFSKITIGLVIPNIRETVVFEVSKDMGGIFVKATGHHPPVPGDYG